MEEFESEGIGGVRFMDHIVSSWYAVYRDDFLYLEALSFPVFGMKDDVLFDCKKNSLGLVIGLFKFDTDIGFVNYYFRGNKLRANCQNHFGNLSKRMFFVLKRLT